MDKIQLKLCDIQGRLFVKAAETGYGSEGFVRDYMMFHTMDPQVAIDDLKEIYYQKHPSNKRKGLPQA